MYNTAKTKKSYRLRNDELEHDEGGNKAEAPIAKALRRRFVVSEMKDDCGRDKTTRYQIRETPKSLHASDHVFRRRKRVAIATTTNEINVASS